MMDTVTRRIASPADAKPLPRLLAGVVLAASLATPSLAGQASGAFNVSITVVPGSTSCSAAVNGGAPLVSCAPVATLVASAAVVTTGVAQDGLRFRLPDTRVRVSGAPVEVREESASEWGVYSSRLIASGGIEYLEMTVTW